MVATPCATEEKRNADRTAREREREREEREREREREREPERERARRKGHFCNEIRELL